MECSEKPVFHNYTVRELAQIRITPPDEAVRKLVKKHWDTLAKPLDGMGSFETITAQIGAILGTEVIDIRKKGVLLFCADNGIVEEDCDRGGGDPVRAGGYAGGGKVHGQEGILRLQDGTEHRCRDHSRGHRDK